VWVEEDLQFVAAVVEFGCGGGQGLQAWSAEVFGHGAGFEGV
jgi:hypothetical protein